MPSVCLYFQVHQPRRIKRYRIFDVGVHHDYFDATGEDDLNNRRIMRKVAEKCYIPANEILLRLLRRYPEFRVSFSFSGVFLEQAEEWEPEVIASFQRLVATGKVELLSETYYHSLAFLYSRREFDAQIALHEEKIQTLFGVETKIFRNTELIYNNDLARHIASKGYRGILAEGADHILGWRSPNFLYHPEGIPTIGLLLKNYRLSDDIAFRFSDQSWNEYPLTAEKFSRWIASLNGNAQCVNLFMDYETFGEHQWIETGIFSFLESLPGVLLRERDIDFATPSELMSRYPLIGPVDIPEFLSWADTERDLSAWRSNDMQHDALRRVYELEGAVLASGDKVLIHQWRLLQTSDHFYYMCTKWFNDGDVHAYFNPYHSPYEAFLSFMNVLHDVQLQLK